MLVSGNHPRLGPQAQLREVATFPGGPECAAGWWPTADLLMDNFPPPLCGPGLASSPSRRGGSDPSLLFPSGSKLVCLKL